jgi:hypothetical protein
MREEKIAICGKVCTRIAASAALALAIAATCAPTAAAAQAPGTQIVDSKGVLVGLVTGVGAAL